MGESYFSILILLLSLASFDNLCVCVCPFLRSFIQKYIPCHCKSQTVNCSVGSNSLWPLDCSLPGSSVHGILQARILEWIAIPFSRGSSQPRDQTCVSHIEGRFFTIWATREADVEFKEGLNYRPLSWSMASPSGLYKWEDDRGKWRVGSVKLWKLDHMMKSWWHLVSRSMQTWGMSAHLITGLWCLSLPVRCFSAFRVHINYLEILLKWRSWFSRSGVGCEILYF